MRDGVWLVRAHPVRVKLDLLAQGEAATTHQIQERTTEQRQYIQQCDGSSPSTKYWGLLPLSVSQYCVPYSAPPGTHKQLEDQ